MKSPSAIDWGREKRNTNERKMDMTRKKIIKAMVLSLCLAALHTATASAATTHIKAANKDRSIKVEAEIKTPEGYEGPVTSLAEDSTYFENVETGKWASFTCITYMSASDMEKAYDENNGDAIIAEKTHSVRAPAGIELNGVSGSKRVVETQNPSTDKTETTIVGIIPQGDGCLVIKSSVADSEYESILSCVIKSE